MRGWVQILAALLTALISAALVTGSLLLALTENGHALDLVGAAGTPEPNYAGIFTYFEEPPGSPVSPATGTQPAVVQVQLQAATATFIMTCPVPKGWTSYPVGSYDTLAGLAKDLGTSVELLKEGNCLTGNSLKPDTTINIPPNLRPTPASCKGAPSWWVVYLVRAGDTLTSLSQAVGVPVYQIQTNNCMGSSTLIRVGARLMLPRYPSSSPTPTPTRTPTATPSVTPSVTPSMTTMPTSGSDASATASFTPVPSNTSTPSFTPSVIIPSNTPVTPPPTNTPASYPPPPPPSPYPGLLDRPGVDRPE